MTASEALPWVMAIFTAIGGWWVWNDSRDKQHRREQNVDGDKSLKSRIVDLEKRFDDGEDRWSTMHSATTTHVGAIELNLRDVQGQVKRNSDDIQKLWDHRH